MSASVPTSWTDLLKRAFDTHVHASPDLAGRRADFIEVAREAARYNMAGIVYKHLGHSSVDRAASVNRMNIGIEAYGGIVLDLPVGGFNPVAVRATLSQGGQFVWMPVAHARNTVELYQAGELQLVIPPDVSVDDALSPLRVGGGLRPDVEEILRLVAEHDGVLATGHLSPEEALVVVDRARALGVRRLLVNHPCGKSVGATIEQQRQLVAMGCFLEHCYAQCTEHLDGLAFSVVAEAIAEVGSRHCILSSDLGQIFNPPHAEGLSMFARELNKSGVARRDLALMMRDNPRTLIEPRLKSGSRLRRADP